MNSKYGLTFLVAIAALTGCSSTMFHSVVTPARVQTVVALGSYYGGKAAIADGHGTEVAMAYAALKSLQQSGVSDLMAVTKALTDALGSQASGFITSDEGMLLVNSVGMVFSDFWANSGQIALDSKYGVAIRDGLVRGLGLALAPATRSLMTTDKDEELTLRYEAMRARSK